MSNSMSAARLVTHRALGTSWSMRDHFFRHARRGTIRSSDSKKKLLLGETFPVGWLRTTPHSSRLPG